MLGTMKVIVPNGEETRTIDHRERIDSIGISGLYVDVPVLNEGEEILWTVGSRIPMIVKTRPD